MELLDLTNAAHHDTITLPGGTVREVINQTDLGAYEFGRLHALQAETTRLDAAVRGKKATAKQEAELLRVLGDTVKLLIPTVTPAELRKLTRANREQIILVWIANNQVEGDAANPPNRKARRTGGRSSRASRSSTAATRKRGSTSPGSR
jgi:hypothetical protein